MARNTSEPWEGNNQWVWNDNTELEVDEALASEDTRADARVAVIVVVCTVLMAVHYVSGWTFDWG